MTLGTEVGLGPGHIVLVAPAKVHSPHPQFSAHVLWPNGGWIKMPLGREADLGPGDIVHVLMYCGQTAG